MTHDELRKHFSDPVYEEYGPHIDKILAGCPDVTDEQIVGRAARFMIDAEDENVELSPQDAVHLAKYFKPKPLEEIVADLKNAGIGTLSDLERVLNQAAADDFPDYGDKRSPAAVDKAAKLEKYAAMLTKNPDIILVGRPVFWPELESAWLKLAVLCDELTKEEQDILTAMYEVSDGGVVRYRGNIPLAVFDVENIHEA